MLRIMLKNVVALVLPGVASFELGVLCEVFGLDRSDDGLPTYDFAVAGLMAGAPLEMSSGGQLLVPSYGLERAAAADLVAVIPYPYGTRPPDAYLQTLRDAHDRGAWVLSVCSGAFALGHAGLLDDRDCTTHWRYARDLEEQFPRARVEPNVLYVEDRGIVTSAGTAAGIDACLHLVRSEQGAKVANGIARRMVVPPHREGGQAQYIAEPVAVCTSDSLAPLLDWVKDNLGDDLSIERLAFQVHQSPRTFARRFRAEVGTTPHKWVTAQRVAQAEQLLETGDESVDRIAQRVGFGTAAVLRHHFGRTRRTSPLAYRRAFNRSA
jgi:transcriptional regulator GlxA family with amidase domain